MLGYPPWNPPVGHVEVQGLEQDWNWTKKSVVIGKLKASGSHLGPIIIWLVVNGCHVLFSPTIGDGHRWNNQIGKIMFYGTYWVANHPH